jgi:hypothetical protein
MIIPLFDTPRPNGYKNAQQRKHGAFMKYLYVLLFFAFTSSAMAAPIFCRGKNAGPDHGVYAKFSSDHKSASITMQSIAGPKTLANLECHRAARRGPDFGGAIPLIACNEPELRDAGYALQLKRGNGLGNYTANLYQVTIAGRELVERMNCVAAMN